MKQPRQKALETAWLTVTAPTALGCWCHRKDDDRGHFVLGAVTLGQGAFLVAHPTEDSARRWSRMKLSTLMRSTAILREMFPQRSRDSADAVFYNERRDGLASILITGANSPASLSQVTIANQCQDDLSKWDVNSAGDPEAMADSRSRAMPDAKILKISTPLITPEELSRRFAGTSLHPVSALWRDADSRMGEHAGRARPGAPRGRACHQH